MTRGRVQLALVAIVALLTGWQAALAWEIIPPIETPAGQIVVHLAPGYEDLAATRNLSTSFGGQVSLHANRPGWLTVTTPENVSPEDFAATLRARPEIDGADPHLRCYALTTPNDPMYRPAEDPDPESGYEQFYLFHTDAAGAWDISTGSADVTIAVLDSGVSFYHEDMAGQIWTNTGEIADNGIDDDGNGFVDDVHGWDFAGDNVGDPDTDDVASFDSNPNVWDPAWWDDAWGQPPGDDTWWDDPVWLARLETIDPAIGNTVDEYVAGPFGDPDAGVTHGTNVAGIAAALTNNATGMAGMGWNSSIMPIRIINAEGWGWGLDAADAISYAADAGADIINMSFGFGHIDFENPPEPGEEGYADYLEALEVRDAIVYAAGQGCIIVAAAGNSGAVGLDFPASMPETISVGSIDYDYSRSYYSAMAATDEYLDVVTPGEYGIIVGIATTHVLDMTTWASWRSWGMDCYLGQDAYAYVNGTSFSCPQVSGLAALYRAIRPDCTLDEFRTAIQTTGFDLGASGYDPEYGWGLLNAAGALEYGENIPEPVTASLFVVGLGAIALKLRRRR